MDTPTTIAAARAPGLNEEEDMSQPSVNHDVDDQLTEPFDREQYEAEHHSHRPPTPSGLRFGHQLAKSEIYSHLTIVNGDQHFHCSREDLSVGNAFPAINKNILNDASGRRCKQWLKQQRRLNQQRQLRESRQRKRAEAKIHEQQQRQQQKQRQQERQKQQHQEQRQQQLRQERQKQQHQEQRQQQQLRQQEQRQQQQQQERQQQEQEQIQQQQQQERQQQEQIQQQQQQERQQQEQEQIQQQQQQEQGGAFNMPPPPPQKKKKKNPGVNTMSHPQSNKSLHSPI